jgi:tetratricopeptide (TPR) repeat protein
MTVTPTTTGIGPPRVAAEAQAPTASVGTRLARGIMLGLAIVVVLFAATYALAWWRANRLTATFMADANTSYSAGNYIESLTGYEEFDSATNRYVTHGGYMQVAKIWADPRAWPVPGSVVQAQARIDEILSQRLTIEEAESFIQANIGKQNPYMGTIYLRLGELYEQDGDIQSATGIYEEIEELFPGEAALIERAKAHLARLNNS